MNVDGGGETAVRARQLFMCPAACWATRFALLLLLMPGTVVHAQGALTEPPGYAHAVYTATKFGLSLEATIEIGAVDNPEVMRWPDGHDGEAALPRRDRWMGVMLARSGLGRSSNTSLLLDADDGRAMQRVRVEAGDSYKATRYGTTGLHVVRKSPGPGEEASDSDSWSYVSRRYERFPPGADLSRGISDPTALFYMLAAGALREPGDTWVIPVFLDDEVVSVDMRAGAWDLLDVDYRDSGRRARGTVRALRIAVATTRAGGQSDDDLGVLGIRGDFEVWLDPLRRVPLLIRGSAPLVGQVDIRLQELR